MNTNALHNVLNMLMLVFGAVAGFDFASIGLSPTLAGKIIAALALAKLVINAVRDGLAGMVKEQPPVK